VEAGAQPDPKQALPVVRTAVRDLLSSSQAFHSLSPEEQKAAARAMVKVCKTAVSLMQEEAAADLQARSGNASARPRAIAAAQEFSGVSASKVAGTTQAILNAVSFPRFVTDLINGVFKALVDSNHQQMAAYVDLIKNVAATVDGFADTSLGPDQARQWVVDAFPGSFEIQGGADEDTAPEDRAEENESARLRLRDDASMPSEEALRTALGLAPEESVPTGDPESTLMPFARRMIARQRQQVLASMVMMGMQRIVIESGRINASMRFHIDTRSAAAADSASRFDFQNKLEASGKFSVGIWGMEAKMQNTIGYVSTQKQQSTEEMNTDLDLNSSVELIFKTDYLPLDRMAGKSQVDRIKVNTINPEAEEKLASQERQARLQGARTAEAARDKGLDEDLKPTQGAPTPETPAQSSPAPPAPKPAAASPTAPVPAGGTAAKAGPKQSASPSGVGASSRRTSAPPSSSNQNDARASNVSNVV
jgi:hypothetical protein